MLVRSELTNRSLERQIRELVAAKDFSRIQTILDQLCNDNAYAVNQPHARNGGLIGLAAAAIALGPVCQSLSFLFMSLGKSRTYPEFLLLGTTEVSRGYRASCVSLFRRPGCTGPVLCV